MSEIDCWKHELVGMFGSIWVYRPLEDIAEDVGEFDCKTNQLVIGGGGGEHPALVLKDPERAVEMFAVCADGDESNKDQKEFDIPDDVEQRLRFKDREDVLGFYNWNSETHHNFFLRCTRGFLPNPYDPKCGTGFDDWLILGFGEFIYYAMPELAPKATKFFEQYQINALHMRYNNILAVPPRIPVYANGGNAFFK
jgi:hypothetical protein